MEYGIFQLIRDEWILVYVYGKLSDAEAEHQYLCGMCGLTVKIFKRSVRGEV